MQQQNRSESRSRWEDREPRAIDSTEEIISAMEPYQEN